jgi:hypothetical protein
MRSKQANTHTSTSIVTPPMARALKPHTIMILLQMDNSLVFNYIWSWDVAIERFALTRLVVEPWHRVRCERRSPAKIEYVNIQPAKL